MQFTYYCNFGIWSENYLLVSLVKRKNQYLTDISAPTGGRRKKGDYVCKVYKVQQKRNVNNLYKSVTS